MLHPNPTPPPIRARVIKYGNSVPVRLPASLGLKPGDEVDLDIRRVNAWPEGFFDLEPSPDFPMPERTSPAAREARKKRLFDEIALGEMDIAAGNHVDWERVKAGLQKWKH